MRGAELAVMLKRQAAKMIDNIIIRQANLDDAQKLKQYSENCFIETFAHLYPKEDLDFFLSEKYSLEVVQKQISDNENYILIAQKQNGNFVGYAMSSPMGLPLKDAKENAYELVRLYVSQEAKGKGIAKKLYDMVLKKAHELNSSELYLGVYYDNLRAQSFYKKLGFEIVGNYLFPVGKTMDDERIMRLNPTIYAESK